MTPPIHKIGLCVLAGGRVLLVQPRGKLSPMSSRPRSASGTILATDTASIDPEIASASRGDSGVDIPPYVLPRGTRAWRDAGGALVDARTLEDAAAHADALEELRDTAKREAHEEAGVSPALFDACDVRALGSMLYHSETGKGSYPIYWFTLLLTEAQLTTLETPVDSSSTRFVTLAEFETMVAEGKARAGYLEVARRAMASR